MAASEGARQGITLLREFRARLVAGVVTGKLDVRAAAAALPEITEAEPVDEPIDGEDLEEAIDDAGNEAVAA
jgi:type I restriction enzyme S subunit